MCGTRSADPSNGLDHGGTSESQAGEYERREDRGGIKRSTQMEVQGR